MNTIYSNLVNIRLTPTELVLEFGNHFPNQPGLAPPSDFKPDIRVVMTAAALEGLANALAQTVKQRQGAQPPKPVGFVTQ
jgi:hypothetical protein